MSKGHKHGSRHNVALSPREIYKLFRSWGWEPIGNSGHRVKLSWDDHVVTIPSPSLASNHSVHQGYLNNGAAAMDLPLVDFLAGPRVMAKYRAKVIHEWVPSADEVFSPEEVDMAVPGALASALAAIKRRETDAENETLTIPPFAFEDAPRCFTAGCVYAEGHDPDRWPHHIDPDLLPVIEDVEEITAGQLSQLSSPSPASPTPLATQPKENTMSTPTPTSTLKRKALAPLVHRAVNEIGRDCTIAEIAEKAGLDLSQVYSAAKRMARAGSIVQVATGVYAPLTGSRADHRIDVNVNGPTDHQPTPVPAVSAPAVPVLISEVQPVATVDVVTTQPVASPVPRYSQTTPVTDEALWQRLAILLDGRLPQATPESFEAISVWLEATRTLLDLKAKEG